MNLIQKLIMQCKNDSPNWINKKKNYTRHDCRWNSRKKISILCGYKIASKLIFQWIWNINETKLYSPELRKYNRIYLLWWADITTRKSRCIWDRFIILPVWNWQVKQKNSYNKKVYKKQTTYNDNFEFAAVSTICWWIYINFTVTK